MRYIPDHLEPDEHRQNKDNKVLHKAGRGHKPDAQQNSSTHSQQRDLIAGLRLEICGFFGALFLGGQGFGRFFAGRGRNGRDFGLGGGKVTAPAWVTVAPRMTSSSMLCAGTPSLAGVRSVIM